jgi:hypothetical protein
MRGRPPIPTSVPTSVRHPAVPPPDARPCTVSRQMIPLVGTVSQPIERGTCGAGVVAEYLRARLSLCKSPLAAMQGPRDRESLLTPLLRGRQGERLGLSRGIAIPRGRLRVVVRSWGCVRDEFVVWTAANQQRHKRGVVRAYIRPGAAVTCIEPYH